MKVISGGIPGRPEHTQDAGDIYAVMSEIAIARSEQLRSTEHLVRDLHANVCASFTASYQGLNDVMDDHIAKRGKHHGESLATLGIPMVNDYPFTHCHHVTEGGYFEEYLHPKALSDAIKRATPVSDGSVMASGWMLRARQWENQRLEYTNCNSMGDGSDWEVCSPFRFQQGVGMVGQGTNYHMLSKTSPVDLTRVYDVFSKGMRSGQAESLGWESVGFLAEIDQGLRLFHRFQDFQLGKPHGIIPNEVPDLAKTAWQLQWLDPGILDTPYTGGVLWADAEGVHFGLTRAWMEETSHMYRDPSHGQPTAWYGYGGEPLDINFTWETLAGTENVLKRSWSQITGKDGVTFDHTEDEVYGGFEWIIPGHSLLAFLPVNLKDATNKPYTAFFAWEINTSHFTNLTITRKSAPFDWDKDAVAQLPENHPFHPVNGRGVFKNDGGHISGQWLGRNAYYLEHAHDIASLYELFEHRNSIDQIPVGTDVVIHPSWSSSPIGNACGRMFLTSAQTMINGQYHASGEWSFFYSKYDGDMTRAGTNPYREFNDPVSVTPIFEYGHYDHELVNTISHTGDINLTGLVWSTENLFQGIEQVLPVTNSGLHGKKAELTESTLEWVKAEAKTLQTNNDEEAYLAIVGYPIGNELRAFIMRVNRIGDVDVAGLRSLVRDGKYEFTRTHDYVNVYDSAGPVDAPGNYRDFLKRDFYIWLDSSNTPKITLKHPLTDRALYLTLTINDATVSVVKKVEPSVSKLGLTEFDAVYPFPDGIYIPMEGSSAIIQQQDNQRMRLYTGGERVGTRWYPHPDFRFSVGNSSLRIPPGASFQIVNGRDNYLYLGLKDGMVDCITLDDYAGSDEELYLTLYGVVDSSGQYSPD